MSWDVVARYKLDMSGDVDNAPQLAQLAADIKRLHENYKPFPRLSFTEGVLAFSTWPDLAYSRLQMYANGQCVLKHIGTGNGVVFDGALHLPNMTWDLVFDGFTVLPGPHTLNSLVLSGIHWSRFRDISVQGAGPPIGATSHSALVQNWCVSTRFDNFTCLVNDAPELPAQTYQCHGIWIDGPTPALANIPSSGPTTQALFVNLNISLVSDGIVINNGNNCMFFNGAVQGCTRIGLLIAKGGYNRIMNVDFEANAYDIQTISGQAHSNKIWRPGNYSGYKMKLDGWNNSVIHDVQDGMFGM